jgi:hypothetical protein
MEFYGILWNFMEFYGSIVRNFFGNIWDFFSIFFGTFLTFFRLFGSRFNPLHCAALWSLQRLD